MKEEVLTTNRPMTAGESDERFPIPVLGVELELSAVYEGVSVMVEKG